MTQQPSNAFCMFGPWSNVKAGASAALLLLAAGLAPPALAAPVLRLALDAPLPHPGQPLDIGVYVDGLGSGPLGTRLGAFDLSLSYTAPATLATPGVVFGTGLGDADDATQTLTGVDTSVSGLLRFYEISLLEESAATCVFCSGPYLDALQANSLRLATLKFDVGPLAVGTVSFNLEAMLLTDATGDTLTHAAVGVGTLSVPVPVSEPTGLAWLALVGAALASRLPSARTRGLG